MRKSKFNESQIVGILKEADAGVPVADLLRKHGLSKATYFKWRSKYAGASLATVRRLATLLGTLRPGKPATGEGSAAPASAADAQRIRTAPPTRAVLRACTRARPACRPASCTRDRQTA